MIIFATVIVITVVLALLYSQYFKSFAAPGDAELSNENGSSQNENLSTDFFGEPGEGSDFAGFNSDRPSGEVIKVGYYITEGFQMRNDLGMHSGYGYEYLQKIRTYTGWDYEYIGDDEDYSFAELFDMVIDGEIDLIGGVNWTKDRAEKLIFSDVPIDMEYTTVYIGSGNNSYAAGEYDNWTGIRLGFVRGTSYVDAMKDFAKNNFFTYKAYYYDSDEDLVDALELGEIDAFVSGSSHNFSNVSVLSQFNPNYLFFVTGLDNQEIMDEVNYALSQIETVDVGFQEALVQKYYKGKGSNAIKFTATETLYIDSIVSNNRKFVLLANPDACPLSYLDYQGNPTGILVDLSKAIFDSIGISYEFYKVSNSKEYIDAANEKKADIIIDFSSDYNRSEISGYFECNSYYNTSLSYVRKIGATKLDTVIKRDGDSIFNDQVLNGFNNTSNVIIVGSLYETEKYLLTNDDSCTYIPKETANVMVGMEETNKLISGDVSYDDLNYCFAVSEGCGNYLVGIFNKACTSFSSEKRSEIISRYNLTDYSSNTLKAFMYDNPVYGFIIIAALIVIFFLIMIIYIGKINREKVENLNIQLKHALDSEKKASEARKRFFNNMNHDMRTPLNGILGLTRTIIDSGRASEVELDYLHKVEDSAGYLEILIDDTLTMSNMGQAEFKLDLKFNDPGQVFNSLKNITLTYAHERNIRFVIRRKELVNLPTKLDYNRLEQVVINVISNAVKFSHKNGTVEIDIKSRMLNEDKVEYTLSIQDHGIGMSEEFQSKMFDAYTQENRGEMTDHAGTGMGLVVVKVLVEMMGGTININSKENIGTIVTMTFVFEVDSLYMIRELKDDVSTTSLNGKRFIYCEDNELNMDIVCAILESEHASVERAWNGKEGLDFYNSMPAGTFDAILMDIRMPVMDGYTAAKAIRNSNKEDAKTIPIIAISANAFEDDKEASRNAGMNSHLSKPIDPKLLINELKKYIGI